MADEISHNKPEPMDIEESGENKKQLIIDDDIKNYVIVDLLGYRNRHRFICKEFCLIDGGFTYHTIIKNPHPFKDMSTYYKRHAEWAMRYFHGLSMECGDIHVVEMIQKMYPKLKNKKILMYNSWKIPWMRYLFRNYDEIECVCIQDTNIDMDLRMQSDYTYCDYHKENGPEHSECSLACALEMKDIVETNFELK